MSDCQVTNFGILTNGAFSVCFRRGVGGGGAPPRKQEEVKPRMIITKVEEDDIKKRPIDIIIKRIV
jgi:hypothetical protein